ncbi:MAG: helix-turn-helix domain-containing protein [Vicinamibacterales bacterium]
MRRHVDGIPDASRAASAADAATVLDNSDTQRRAPGSARGLAGGAREPAWVSPREAAAYLGVGVDTIYEACAAGDLKHAKLGYRTIRLRREWIDRWAEGHADSTRD